MNPIKKNTMLKSLIVMVLAFLVSGYLHLNQLIGNSSWYLLCVPVAAFAINFLAFSSATVHSLRNNLSTQISVLFGIKFFSYLIVTVIFLVLEKEKSQRLFFVIYLFPLYMANTAFLLQGILKYQKSIQK